MVTTRGTAAAVVGPGDVDAVPTVRFEAPQQPGKHVERRDLLAALDRAADQPLLLVSAPAGSGKTTLVGSWVARLGTASVAWLTHEKGDDRPDRFWRLVLGALDRCGADLHGDRPTAGPDAHARMLADLGARLSHLGQPVTLVLDGFEVSDPRLAGEIDFVLHHSGQRLRLVMLTRTDPVLPLHRLRLEGTVCELRMADLAFSEEETSRLLDLFGVRLGPDGVATLLDRTRGWAAGLRYAAMLLAGSEAPLEALERMAGDTGDIAEYLTAEMLQGQPASTRSLLRRTSVVDVLQPGLVEQLAGVGAGRSLAALSRGNLLVEELPGRPGWFRYHPLLRDLLRAEFAYTAPQGHRRARHAAARWFAEQGHVREAVGVASAGSEWADAARYAVEGLALAGLVTGEDGDGLVTVMRSMPTDTTGSCAALVRAALALADGRTDRCADELSEARRDAPGGDSWDLAVDVVKTVLARSVDDPRAVPLALRALARLAAINPVGAAVRDELLLLVRTNLGLAQVRSGHLVAARATLTRAVRTAPPTAPAGRSLAESSFAHLALGAALEGRPDEAEQWGLRSSALSDGLGRPADQRPPEVRLALGWASTERRALPAAWDHLEGARRSHSADPFVRALSTLLEARLLLTQGDPERASRVVRGLAESCPAAPAWLPDRLGPAVASGHTPDRDGPRPRAGIPSIPRQRSGPPRSHPTRVPGSAVGPHRGTPGPLLEPLTPKEQEVLGHLSELLSTEEIAAEMFVSVNTVRTHVRNILRKLAVSRRNEAVRLARALRLIGAPT
jgi:LuxR family maltose regulon positive regulatory protein